MGKTKSIVVTIRNGREILCLPYAGFFLSNTDYVLTQYNTPKRLYKESCAITLSPGNKLQKYVLAICIYTTEQL